MLKLGFDITKITFLREKEYSNHSLVDPIWFSVLAQIAGVDVLILHLGDNEKIEMEELSLIRKIAKVPVNLKLKFNEESLEIARKFLPDAVTFYSPDAVFNSLSQEDLFKLREVVSELKELGIKVSAFVDPQVDLVREAVKSKVDFVELNVKDYFMASGKEKDKKYDRLLKAARFASTMRTRVIVGHGVNYQSLSALLGLPALEEIHVGRSIIARALLVGLSSAIKEMIEIINLKSGR